MGDEAWSDGCDVYRYEAGAGLDAGKQVVPDVVGAGLRHDQCDSVYSQLSRVPCRCPNMMAADRTESDDGFRLALTGPGEQEFQAAQLAPSASRVVQILSFGVDMGQSVGPGEVRQLRYGRGPVSDCMP